MQQRHNYPLDESECLFSGPIYVLRRKESDGYGFLPTKQTFQTFVVSCAAIAHPPITADLKYADARTDKLMARKIELILNVFRARKFSAVVLSALGCGAFGNPPTEVARLFKEALDSGIAGFHLREVTVAAAKYRKPSACEILFCV